LGIGDWGLGIGDWAQSPIPNPQSPIPNPHIKKLIRYQFLLPYNIIIFYYLFYLIFKLYWKIISYFLHFGTVGIEPSSLYSNSVTQTLLWKSPPPGSSPV